MAELVAIRLVNVSLTPDVAGCCFWAYNVVHLLPACCLLDPQGELERTVVCTSCRGIVMLLYSVLSTSPLFFKFDRALTAPQRLT